MSVLQRLREIEQKEENNENKENGGEVHHYLLVIMNRVLSPEYMSKVITPKSLLVCDD